MESSVQEMKVEAPSPTCAEEQPPLPQEGYLPECSGLDESDNDDPFAHDFELLQRHHKQSVSRQLSSISEDDALDAPRTTGDLKRKRNDEKSANTPSMEVMDVNGNDVDADKDEPSEEDMVVDPPPAKPTFSESPSPSVDWKRGTKTSSEDSSLTTAQDALSLTPSDLLPAPHQSSQDTGSDYSTTPALSCRVTRGPGSSAVSAPIFKPLPCRSKPEPEPSLSQSGRPRRARIATQKVQLKSEEKEEEDSEGEGDELKSSPLTTKSLSLDDWAYPGRKPATLYPCSVPGCTKTYARRSDVERHIKSSNAHDKSKRSAGDMSAVVKRVGSGTVAIEKRRRWQRHHQRRLRKLAY
ncbi:hypothetical protein BDZ89DRAFT_1141521 [Hymenopellis radicata]|nr:hypothetical protein BDZ89DRAFT_1141521 [Hymenopellis radicata]